jgi:UDP-GlcNAc:undecaprenyl-phosphate GlcNAc-1-phosphate transferase
LLILVSAAVGLLGSLVAPLFIKPFLMKRNVLDVPNERSSHVAPVLRGGGLAVAFGAVVAYLTYVLSGAVGAINFVILATVLAAALVGWIEDDKGLPAHVRAVLQLVIGVAGAGAVVALLGGGPVVWIVGTVAIAAYINVANFMDGINGISALHGLVVGVAYGVGGLAEGLPWLALGGFVLAAVFTGFLPWNLFGRGLFLGDVGSYVLGAFVAVLAVAAVASGLSLLFVVGPISIYLADSGFTLIRRTLRGEKWYEAHRTHQYQMLTTYGASHVAVSLLVALASAAAAVVGFVSLNTAASAAWILTALLLAVLLAYFLIVDVARRRFVSRGLSEVG